MDTVWVRGVGRYGKHVRFELPCLARFNADGFQFAVTYPVLYPGADTSLYMATEVSSGLRASSSAYADHTKLRDDVLCNMAKYGPDFVRRAVARLQPLMTLDVYEIDLKARPYKEIDE